MQTPLIDIIHNFAGFGGCASHCRVRLFAHAAAPVVVLAEVADNEGTSVTNAVEHIAAQLCNLYALDATDVIWVEHYPDARTPFERSLGNPNEMFEEEFSAVNFDAMEQRDSGWRLRGPRWTSLSRKSLETLTATKWAPECAQSTKK